jgi:DNA-binding HxlR family transcriptional regulator
MTSGYGQYCPISRAAEVLGDRWTILIVRDLLLGATRFNEVARGNPGLSRSLLSRRFDQLIRAGIVERQPDASYRLTEAGEELRPLLFGFAAWGARWAFGDPEPEELDPDLLVWWLHRAIDPSDLPGPRYTIFLRLADHPKRFWIVVEEEASVCVTDPGFDVDVTVTSDRATLYRVYIGRVTLRDALRQGSVDLSGRRAAVSAFIAGFGTAPIAGLVAEADRAARAV